MSSPGATPVVAPNEIKINDVSFPTMGPVRRMNISVPPNPITFGDSTRRGDSQAMSEQIQSTNQGGSGTYIAESRIETDVNWTSQAETRYRNALTLPPLTVSMGKPAALSDEEVTFSITYRNEQYFVFADKVYRWADASDTWSALEYTLPGTPTDAVVFNGTLYIATGSGYSTRDSAGTWADSATDAYLFVVWDAKLYRLVQNVGAWELYSLPAGGAWSALLSTITADIVPTQMLVYRDAAGATAIYLITKSGLWVYDADAARWNETEIQYPRTQYSPRGTVFRDGKMYVSPGGLGFLSVQSGSQFIVSAVGLDQKDGVPEDEVGWISAVASDQNWVMALTVAGEIDDEVDEYSALAEPLWGRPWSASTGKTVLRVWNGGWHRLWTSPTTGTPGFVLTVGAAYDTTRVYWSSAGECYYQALDLGLFNPRQVGGRSFDTGPAEHITPWFDFGTPTQDKIHGHLLVETLHCTALNTIEVYYGTNLDESWTLLDTVTTDGLNEYLLGGPVGLQARYFRFKYTLTRNDSDDTTAPLLVYWSSQFMRVMRETPAFAVTVFIDQPYGGKPPAELTQLLFNYSDWQVTPNFIKFCFQDHLDSTAKTYYGRITRLSGTVWTGQQDRGEGTYQVSFIVPYGQDAIVG